MTIQTWNSSRYLLFLSALFSASSSANEYSTIVGFGDSLTDTGNKYVDTGLLNRPPYDLLNEFRVPDGPYAGGGLQHSNGATWIEQSSMTVRPPNDFLMLRTSMIGVIGVSPAALLMLCCCWRTGCALSWASVLGSSVCLESLSQVSVSSICLESLTSVLLSCFLSLLR